VRRKENIRNYGNSWIKPPGISKTLHQQREEQREQKEHNEAMRREALAQELADAEAEALAAAGEEMMQGEGMEEIEEVRDLDDEVPEADVTGIEADDSEDEENDEVPRGVLASRMPEDAYREALVRGEDVRGIRFGDETGEDLGEEEASQMLQEEDLLPGPEEHLNDVDMDMDADLDADVPDGESEGYEHTDTEEELSSSVDGSERGGFSRPAAASSMVRSDGTQNSLDFGSMMSPGSSQLGSSPAFPTVQSGSRQRRSGHGHGH
jgi:hypothetical protein